MRVTLLIIVCSLHITKIYMLITIALFLHFESVLFFILRLLKLHLPYLTQHLSHRPPWTLKKPIILYTLNNRSKTTNHSVTLIPVCWHTCCDLNPSIQMTLEIRQRHRQRLFDTAQLPMLQFSLCEESTLTNVQNSLFLQTPLLIYSYSVTLTTHAL